MKSMLFLLFMVGMLTANAQDDKTPQSVKFPPKGSKIYLEADNEREQNITSHLTDRIRNWGYWDVVLTKDEAEYLIELVVAEKGTGAKGYVLVKKKDGTELAKSKTIKAQGDPGNGFSAYRGFSIGIGRWLKEPK